MEADALDSPFPYGDPAGRLNSCASFGGSGKAAVGGGRRGGMFATVSERPIEARAPRERRELEVELEEEAGLEGRSKFGVEGDGVRTSAEGHGRGADNEPLGADGGVGSGLEPRRD